VTGDVRVSLGAGDDLRGDEARLTRSSARSTMTISPGSAARS
jgi:hypothetical protein